MKPNAWQWLRSFVLEAVAYAVLVVGYFFLVLHLLGDWLYQLYVSERRWYAAVALALVICQGIILELLTRFLLALAKPRREAE